MEYQIVSESEEQDSEWSGTEWTGIEDEDGIENDDIDRFDAEVLESPSSTFPLSFIVQRQTCNMILM